jgi:hypothetical protein
MEKGCLAHGGNQYQQCGESRKCHRETIHDEFKPDAKSMDFRPKKKRGCPRRAIVILTEKRQDSE